MKKIRILAVAICAILPGALAAQGEVKRKELGRTLGTADTKMETIVTELRMMPGAYIPLHTHPGDETVYVVKGGPMMTKDGTVVPFNDGASFVFPRGQVHGGLTSVGEGEIVAITIHSVDAGQPMTELAE